MVTERSELLIAAGKEDAFAAIMAEHGLPLLRALSGVRSVSLGRGVENPDKFLLLIEWADMADHTAFTGTPAFPELMALIQPYSVGGVMEHFAYD